MAGSLRRDGLARLKRDYLQRSPERGSQSDCRVLTDRSRLLGSMQAAIG